MADDDIPFERELSAAPGQVAELSPLARRIIAGNGGPFTFTGTCSYIVGRGTVAVIDPGPDDPAHLDALLRATRASTSRTSWSPTPIAITLRSPAP